MENIDDFFQEKCKPATTGTKIRMVKANQHRSTKELSKIAKMSESVMRSYENSSRKVPEEKLKKIAEALEVPKERLHERNISNYVDVMQILFELSDLFEVKPIKLPQALGYAVATKDETMARAIQLWYSKNQQWECNKISLEEYKNWIDSFPLKIQPEDMEELDTKESYYTDIERIISLKRTVETLELIVKTNVEEIEANLDKKQYEYIREELKSMERTICSIGEKDIEKYG